VVSFIAPNPRRNCQNRSWIARSQLLLSSTDYHGGVRDFSHQFGVETIERFLHHSCDEFAGRATATNFLPLLAERFARQRLQALAKVEGLSDDGKPVVLFLCTHNAGRSQMALGFFTRLISVISCLIVSSPDQ
jgi:arsenate reductase